MIPQEKEEHKSKGMSSQFATPTSTNNDDTRIFEASPTGLPAKNDSGRMVLAPGWENNDLRAVEEETELSYLYTKVESLKHQVKVLENLESLRLEESEKYRQKLLKEELLEVERLAKLEPVPLLLTRGAHSEINSPKTQRVNIDWISFTCSETTEILKEFLSFFTENLRFESLSRGMTGYKSVIAITHSGEQIGLIGHGTSHGKNLLTLTGKGCKVIKDWHLFKYWLEKLENFTITRLDLAHDFFMGEMTHDIVMESYKLDKFKALKSSKNPSIGVQSSVDGMGRNRGRTINIGGRNSGKTVCCYEKGLEQFSKLYGNNGLKDDEVNFLITNIDCHEIDERVPEGTTLLNWYRIEVRFGNADKVLSSDMLIDRDMYFSGSYPFCEEVMKMDEVKKPQRVPNNLETEIEVMFKHIREQYGSFITTMLASGMTPNEVLKKCVNGKISQRIVKAGGLEIVKPFDPKILDDK